MSDTLHQHMQESLDGALSEQKMSELLENLQVNTRAAQEYQRLSSVNQLLASAPQVRAPQRLASAIMARLTETLEREAHMQALPEETRKAMLLSLNMVLQSMKPALVAASWLVLNARHDPVLLTQVTLSSIGVMKMTIDALQVVLDEVERLLHDDPKAAPIGALLIPSLLLSLLDYLEDTDQQLQSGQAPESE